MIPRFLNTLATCFLSLLPFLSKIFRYFVHFPFSPDFFLILFTFLSTKHDVHFIYPYKSSKQKQETCTKYIFYLLIKVKFLNNINMIFLKWLLYLIIVFSILYIKCLILFYKDMLLVNCRYFLEGSSFIVSSHTK